MRQHRLPHRLPAEDENDTTLGTGAASPSELLVGIHVQVTIWSQTRSPICISFSFLKIPLRGTYCLHGKCLKMLTAAVQTPRSQTLAS